MIITYNSISIFWTNAWSIKFVAKNLNEMKESLALLQSINHLHCFGLMVQTVWELIQVRQWIVSHYRYRIWHWSILPIHSNLLDREFTKEHMWDSISTCPYFSRKQYNALLGETFHCAQQGISAHTEHWRLRPLLHSLHSFGAPPIAFKKEILLICFIIFQLSINLFIDYIRPEIKATWIFHVVTKFVNLATRRIICKPLQLQQGNKVKCKGFRVRIRRQPALEQRRKASQIAGISAQTCSKNCILSRRRRQYQWDSPS